jgi:hypothetical protein
MHVDYPAYAYVAKVPWDVRGVTRDFFYIPGIPTGPGCSFSLKLGFSLVNFLTLTCLACLFVSPPLYITYIVV